MQILRVASRVFFDKLRFVWALSLAFLIWSGGKAGWIPKPRVIKPPVSFLRPPPDMSSVNIEIAEVMIRKAAEMTGREEYRNLIEAGDVFREANLTPVFLTDRDQNIVRVRPREYIDTPWILN
jgi:hypothetical protein